MPASHSLGKVERASFRLVMVPEAALSPAASPSLGLGRRELALLLRSLPKSLEVVPALGLVVAFKRVAFEWPRAILEGMGEMSMGSHSGRPNEARGGEFRETFDAKESSSSSDER